MSTTFVAKAKAMLEQQGYVVLKAKSYRQAQERQRVAEILRQAEERNAERTRDWARDCLEKERTMRDRCEYLYGLAAAHGATRDELCPWEKGESG